MFATTVASKESKGLLLRGEAAELEALRQPSLNTDSFTERFLRAGPPSPDVAISVRLKVSIYIRFGPPPPLHNLTSSMQPAETLCTQSAVHYSSN